jgi:hypothetical protein
MDFGTSALYPLISISLSPPEPKNLPSLAVSQAADWQWLASLRFESPTRKVE